MKNSEFRKRVEEQRKRLHEKWQEQKRKCEKFRLAGCHDWQFGGVKFKVKPTIQDIKDL